VAVVHVGGPDPVFSRAARGHDLRAVLCTFVMGGRLTVFCWYYITRVYLQELCDSKQREIDAETHLKQLAERELGRIKSDVVKYDKSLNDMQDHLSGLQSNAFKANEKLEAFKVQMNYNQEALEQWALAAKQKDEDSLALAKYTKADEERVRALNLQIEKTAKAAQVRFMCVCLSECMSICLSVCLSERLSVCVSVSVCVRARVCVSMCAITHNHHLGSHAYYLVSRCMCACMHRGSSWKNNASKRK
jgi:hypothetical protein